MIRARILGAGIALVVLVPGGARAQEAVTNPHGEIEAQCQSCHSVAGWRPVSLGDFDHEKVGFALERAHSGLDCADCHAGLKFAGVSSECGSCHSDVHLGELGSDCDRCHTTHTFIDLAQQRQMHREVNFALTGAHAGADCVDCHVPRALGDLQYLGTTTECIDCHREEYESRADHINGQFPEDCDACHGTATFSNGFINHDRLYFPIFSGRHNGEWDDCSICHPSADDFKIFDCLGCHPHSDKTKTDGDHNEEPDYFYDSIECYDCHPDGRK